MHARYIHRKHASNTQAQMFQFLERFIVAEVCPNLSDGRHIGGAFRPIISVGLEVVVGIVVYYCARVLYSSNWMFCFDFLSAVGIYSHV